MRLLLPLFLFLVSFTISAQEENSLLWEISGNGLEQPSYLYGTMHVSKKIAFRLDDVFYDALLNSDVVALESDPATWLEEDARRESSRGRRNIYVPKGFYANSFIVHNPKKEQLGAYLAFEDRMLNGLLYRSDANAENFEEETYLDMFIYQAGRKFNKPIVALEDNVEAGILVGRANLNPMKQKPDEWLQKKLQQKGMFNLRQDAYRERNISFLDSLDEGMHTQYYLKNMLHIRNRNMVVKLDSVMRHKKVFAGIGAAHLPGKKGAIEMLREMGYTVKALTSRSSKKGKSLKSKIETTFRENTLSKQEPDDGVFSINLPNKLYAVADFGNTSYIAPDLANGSYVMVNRIPTHSHLKKDVFFSLKLIDDLLFENIPGKILEKTKLELDGYEAYDIKNQLKNGDHQRYRIYMTPLEIVIFKMGGEGDYVQTHSDAIFNSITFKPLSDKKTVVKSGFDDFSVEMPTNYIFPNRFRSGDRFVQAVEMASNDYFFLKKVTQNDLRFIEEDSFELKQIQKRFYQDLELKPSYDKMQAFSLTSNATFDSINQKKLYLKTTYRRGDYYLLGTISKDEKKANEFFESFSTKEPVFKEEYKQVKDTSLYFTTSTTVKPPQFANTDRSYNRARKKAKEYEAYQKTKIYQNKNNEAIMVSMSKSHDLMMVHSIDSLWNMRKKVYANRMVVSNEKRSFNEKGYHEYQFTVTDTASTRGILVKNIAKDGLIYELRALLDTVHKPSKFITEFYDNFTLKDTGVGKSLVNDKTNQFFDALRKNDSIIVNGHRHIRFNKNHLDSLKKYISNFEFKEEEKNIQASLIQKMGKIKDPRVFAFFREFYGESYNNSGAQTKILQAVSQKSDTESAEFLLELMSKDLPLISNKFEINNIFRPYLDSLPLAKTLFPEILDYSSIEEYKTPIFSMLAKLKAKGMVKTKTYKKYKKQILNDAKIQLKRHLGQNANLRGYSRYNNSNKKEAEILENYAQLLFPFYDEKEMKLFFTRLALSKNAALKTTYASLLAENSRAFPNNLLDSLTVQPKSRGLLFAKLQKIEKAELFPKKFRNQKSIAESQVYSKNNYNNNKFKTEFIEEKSIQFKGKQYKGFLYKLVEERDFNPNKRMFLVVYKDNGKLQSEPFYVSAGFRIKDTDTDEEISRLVTEQFLLKERKRANIFRPELNNRYGGYY